MLGGWREVLVQLCYVGMAGMGTLWRCSTGIRVSRYYFFLFFSSSSACSCSLFPTSDITWLVSTPRSYPEKCFRITMESGGVSPRRSHWCWFPFYWSVIILNNGPDLVGIYQRTCIITTTGTLHSVSLSNLLAEGVGNIFRPFIKTERAGGCT